MGPRSLLQMAETVAIKHLDEVSDLGGLPFWAAKGILERVKHPDQLRTFEEANPILREDTAYLWHRLIHRDFPRPQEKKQYKVEDPTETWTLYYRYQCEEEYQIAQGLAKLKQDMKNLNQKTNTTTLMPASKAPRVPRYSVWPPDGNRYYSKYTGMTKGQIGFAKVLQKTKQARSANHAAVRSPRPITTRLTKAPKGMIHEHTIANRPRPPPRPATIERTTDPTLISREERLRRIKEGKPAEPAPREPPAPPAPPVSTGLSQPSRPGLPPAKRNSGWLSFSPDINANLKITRIPPKTNAPSPSAADRKLSQHFVQPKAARPAFASPPPAIPGMPLPRNTSPRPDTHKAPASDAQGQPQRAPPQRNPALLLPKGPKKRSNAALIALRPMKRPRTSVGPNAGPYGPGQTLGR